MGRAGVGVSATDSRGLAEPGVRPVADPPLGFSASPEKVSRREANVQATRCLCKARRFYSVSARTFAHYDTWPEAFRAREYRHAGKCCAKPQFYYLFPSPDGIIDAFSPWFEAKRHLACTSLLSDFTPLKSSPHEHDLSSDSYYF